MLVARQPHWQPHCDHCRQLEPQAAPSSGWSPHRRRRPPQREARRTQPRLCGQLWGPWPSCKARERCLDQTLLRRPAQVALRFWQLNRILDLHDSYSYERIPSANDSAPLPAAQQLQEAVRNLKDFAANHGRSWVRWWTFRSTLPLVSVCSLAAPGVHARQVQRNLFHCVASCNVLPHSTYT